jgi:CheY-like chemotaxis protein/signal transduction histidine kinase/HAMP domain-containing protein
MNFIKNLKIRDKLLLLLFLLLFPLLYFVGSQVRQDLEERAELQEVSIRLTESEKISYLVHEFQKERARIIAAAEGNGKFLLEAKTSRKLTDLAERELRLFLENQNRAFSELALLNQLQQYRYNLDQNQLDVLEFREYSQKLIFSFLTRMEENAQGISNQRIRTELSGLVSLTQAKIHLGRIRSLLMKTIREGSFSYQDFGLLVSYSNSYDQSLNDFSRLAPGQLIEEVQNLAETEIFRATEAHLHSFRSNPQSNLAEYDRHGVFDLFTGAIESYKTVEGKMLSLIHAQVEAEINSRVRALYTTAFALILTLGLTLLLSVYIINLIASSLSNLRKAADRVSLGATDVHINVHSTDEIGDVAASFRGVIQKNIALAKVAQAIGEGQYEVEVVVQSPEDTLSYALQEMKNNLHRLTTANENRNWILTGVSELNDLITGESALNNVGDKAISFLCAYSASEAGILYLHDDAGKLVPAAGYGLQHPKDQLPSFLIGQGQVGQAVSERKVKILDGIPEEYLNIKTGLSEIKPANIILLPLVFSSTVVGVIELCSRQIYNDRSQEFLKTVSERIAIIIHTLQSHLQTQELLSETQSQAEELEAQQEELRQMNAELKASEEELKVSQEELQEKNAELEEKAQLLEEQFEAVGTKNKALEDAREAIELKIQQVETVSQYKSEFLANMSHELRTPLNSILILSRLLADNPEKNLLPKQAEHAQIIHKSGADLLKLINEILDLSKIESGMIKLETEEVQVQDIDLVPAFAEMAKSKKIKFTLTVAPGTYETITTDRFRLEQILKNFLSNAIKFTDKGGKVALSIYPVNQRPAFKTKFLADYPEIIAFSVSDTGIGIPKEKQEIVFEAFHQADSSTTRKYGGTGLGLTISKELASILGGEIILESEPGVGSNFTLYLPRSPYLESSKGQVPIESAPAFGKAARTGIMLQQQENRNPQEISILIIEDDKAFNDILADFARAKKFNVYQAFTGQEGFTMVKDIKPDAVMLDINLPDMQGWELLKQMRADKELRHINVHMMSAYDREILGNFQDNEEYLAKPVTLEMLNKAFVSISSLTDRSIETILIVEDNEIENKAVAELLQAHKLKSLSAFSAEEAERILAKHKIDCVILDLNLPGMKGYEWMGKVRSTEGLEDLPIIIYSGKDLSWEEEAKLKKFANTIIIKNEYSYLRLLDEVQLFLHKVNQQLPSAGEFKMKLHLPELILKNKKAMIVDDDVRNVYSLASLLELQGMNTVVAYDGQEALDKLQTEKGVDLVLMDIMMPAMDGIEAIKRIRENAQFKRLPIIALTAKAMKEDKEKCIHAGASDYIPKPVDTEKLLTLMRAWLYEA